MKRIAICSPSIEHGDAVSNDMTGMHHVLAKHGHKVCLFVKDNITALPYVKPVEEITRFLKEPDDIVIYHYAIGWDLGLKLLKDLNCRKVIKYHNVTPPEFFEGINAGYVDVCRAGRNQLTEIASLPVDLYIGCSEYSMHELITAGADKNKCTVVPPFHHIDRLQMIDADLNELDRYNDAKTTLVTVGRVAPNKGHLSLIDAFTAYVHHYNPDSRLLIIGGEDTNLLSYVMSLRKKVEDLNLKDKIIFAGKVSDEALKAYYLSADVFMTTSMHEGFCVPLIEAMSMKIPIVAYASSAITETVGKVGLVWDEHNPELLAASVDRIVKDEEVRVSLGEMGWRRYHTLFTNSRIEERFMEVMSTLL